MKNLKETWQEFTTSEIETLTQLLEKKNITLAKDQPHISGERYLMSGKKVVLVGIQNDTNQTVIIKSSTDKASIKELELEQQARKQLQNLPFAYQPLLAPKELWSENTHGRLTIAIEYIDQPKPYLQLPLREQFDLVLGAFSMLAGTHATTASHSVIQNKFGGWSASNYLSSLSIFCEKMKSSSASSDSLQKLLREVISTLTKQHDDIERYCGFLTHDDFALHNFRFRDNGIYLIDQSSLKFGSKHESWGRFLNYMLLYNRELEQALLKYTELNLSPEEQASIRLMRIYKLVELLSYHTIATEQSTGNEQALSQHRLHFWEQVLHSLLAGTHVAEGDVTDYKRKRDELRSPEELLRQKALQQLL